MCCCHLDTAGRHPEREAAEAIDPQPDDARLPGGQEFVPERDFVHERRAMIASCRPGWCDPSWLICPVEIGMRSFR